MFIPLTFTDILKMLFWSLTNPPPKAPSEFVSLPLATSEVKAGVEQLPVPTIVVGASDHNYRVARLHATTAIKCVHRGRTTYHEDHYPNDPPGKGFDPDEGMQLTRINVMLVQ